MDTSTWSEAIVLRELAEYYNDAKGAAWPSIEMLAERCNGISQRTIRRSLVSLTSQGLITRSQRGTKNQPSVYVLNLNWPRVATITPISTGQIRQVNRPNQVSQPAKPGKSTGQIRQVIKGEPLLTIKEPLLLPVPESDFFNRTIKAYEQNMGMISPMIAEQIRAIAEEDKPPAAWGEDAIRIAVGANARNWSYTSAILSRWIQQGSQDDRRKGARDNGSIQGPGIDTLRNLAVQSD